jgi:hypothetical protein
LDSLPREEHTFTVFKNRVPRRLFEPERKLVTASERKLHTEELHNLQAYISPNIIKIHESREIRWVGLVHAKGSSVMSTEFKIGKHKGKGHLEYLNVSGSKILKWRYLMENDVRYGLESS